MRNFFAHRKYFKHFTLADDSKVDELVTRLSFLSQPTLYSFCIPFILDDIEISWINSKELPLEAKIFEQCFSSVKSGRGDIREDALYVLAQILCLNSDLFLKTLYKPDADAFVSLVEKGQIPLEDIMKLENARSLNGVFALGHIEEKNEVSYLVLPSIIRQCFKDITENKTLATTKKIEPEDNGETVAISPDLVCKAWVTSTFLREFSSKPTPQSSEYKTLDGIVGFPKPIMDSFSVSKFTVNPAKIFMTLQNEILTNPSFNKTYNVRKEGLETFPKCTRFLITLFRQNKNFCSFFVTESALHLSNLMSQLSPTLLQEFFMCIIIGIGACEKGKYYNAEKFLTSLFPNKNYPDFIQKRYYYGVSNRYSSPHYYGSSIDMENDACLPIFKIFLVELCMMGLVNLKFGPMPKKSNSQFDHVLGFNLTALGQYAFGKTDVVPEFQPYEIPKCKLDSEYLFIFIPEGFEEFYSPLVKKIAQPIGPTRYAVSKESFTRGIKSRSALTDRINDVRNLVNDVVPPLWEDFFEALRKRCSGVKMEHLYYAAIKINPENTDLLDFIATNEYISETCFRGENYLLFCPAYDLEKIRAEFNSAGFFLE